MPKAVITHTPEQIARAREVHMRGGTQGAVGAVLGVSQQTAGRRIAEWCWPRVRRKMRPDSRIRYLAPEDFAPPVAEPGAFAARDHAGMGAQARRDLAEGLPDKHLHKPARPTPDAGDLTQRLKSLVAREMARVEMCGGPPAEVARTLASLARTLKLLSVMPDIWDGETPRIDYAAYEQEIIARLDALRLEGLEYEGMGI